MLTKGDDFPLHQSAEPIAFAGTDRNFYDRYFFNGYSPDGSVFFAAAMGFYPQLGIIDAAFCVLIDGVQHNIRASRRSAGERLDLAVGPIAIPIDEPLERLTLHRNRQRRPAHWRAAFHRAPFADRGTALHPPQRHPPVHGLYPHDPERPLVGLAVGRWRSALDAAPTGPAPATAAGASAPSARRTATAAAGNFHQFFWLWTPCNFADRSCSFTPTTMARARRGTVARWW